MLCVFILFVSLALAAGNGCPPPSAISNGQFEFITSPKWPKRICRVQYACDLGYKMEGAGLIYCFHSHWVGHIPTCQERNCLQLVAPTYGSMMFVDNQVPANRMDSIVQFSCDDGFELEGEVALVCLDNGNWSSSVPTCVSEGCSGPGVVTLEPTTATPEPTTAAPEPTTAAPKPTTAAPEPTTAATPATETTTETAKQCFSTGYSYTYVETKFMWNEAQSNCKDLGGDIAHHGFESMTFREVLCDHLNLCNNGINEYPWIGLKKVASSPARWEYLDGTPSPDDDTSWWSGYYDIDGSDCGMWYDGAEAAYLLRLMSYPCSYAAYPSICEFACN